MLVVCFFFTLFYRIYTMIWFYEIVHIVRVQIKYIYSMLCCVSCVYAAVSIFFYSRFSFFFSLPLFILSELILNEIRIVSRMWNSTILCSHRNQIFTQAMATSQSSRLLYKVYIRKSKQPTTTYFSVFFKRKSISAYSLFEYSTVADWLTSNYMYILYIYETMPRLLREREWIKKRKSIFTTSTQRASLMPICPFKVEKCVRLFSKYFFFIFFLHTTGQMKGRREQ